MDVELGIAKKPELDVTKDKVTYLNAPNRKVFGNTYFLRYRYSYKIQL